MENNLILVTSLSEESAQAEILLKQNKIQYAEMITGSKSNQPVLISSNSAYSFYGLREIANFIETLPSVSM